MILVYIYGLYKYYKLCHLLNVKCKGQFSKSHLCGKNHSGVTLYF